MEPCVKCGIKANPPTFMVLYTSGNKTRKKSMPVRQFKHNSNCNFVAGQLKERHQLDMSKNKIEKMLRILQEVMKGVDKAKAKQLVEKEIENKSLNKLTTRELDEQKKEMDTLFTQNQIKPEDDTFVYDKQVNFPKPEEASEWDEKDENEREEEGHDFWDNMP